MTKEDEKKLHLFEAKVRMMLERYKTLQAENVELYSMMEKQEQQIKELQEAIATGKKDLDTLKTAKMLEVATGDVHEAQKRVQHLIREIDQCISLLNV